MSQSPLAPSPPPHRWVYSPPPHCGVGGWGGFCLQEAIFLKLPASHRNSNTKAQSEYLKHQLKYHPTNKHQCSEHAAEASWVNGG